MTPEYIVKEKSRLQALELQYADMIQRFKASQAWKNVTTPVQTEDVRIVALKTPSHIVTEEKMTFSCGSDSERDASVPPRFSLMGVAQSTKPDLTPPWSGVSSNCNSPVRNRAVIATKELPSAVSSCNSPVRNRAVITTKELPSASVNAPVIISSNSPMRNEPVITTKQLPPAVLNCSSPVSNRPVITTKQPPPAVLNCSSPMSNRPVILSKEPPPAVLNCSSPMSNRPVIITKEPPPAASNLVDNNHGQTVDKKVVPGGKIQAVAGKPGVAAAVKSKTKSTYKFSMPKGQQLDNLKRLHVSDYHLIGEFHLVLARR